MKLDDAFKLLREKDEPVPKPLRLPTEKDVRDYEEKLNYKFPDEFVKFQLEVGNVTYGTLEPVVCLPKMQPYINPFDIATDGWNEGISKEYLPFCCDNGCYYCMSQNGDVLFWDNDDCSFGNERWSFPDWITKVWLGGNYA
jgi:hypothetical protein